ncbi:MAG: anti-sigma factor family protein [Microbacteriaceae bacterium]
MTDFELAAVGGPAGSDRYLTWDASYVLGALSPSERREFEAHLETCARCSAAVAELTGMPALLAMVNLDEVEALEHQPPNPPLRPELRDQVLDKVRTRRRRSRWVTTVAVGLAAALLAIGLVVVIRPETLGLQQGSPQAVAMEMSKVSETPINASIAMSSYSWGTRIDMACSYGDWGQRDVPAQNLGMVVVGHDGSRTQIATWLGLSGATALPSGNVAIPQSEIASVQLVSADDGKVLLERNL